MEKRICPLCKTNWFSTLSQEDWTCDKCGATIPILKQKSCIIDLKTGEEITASTEEIKRMIKEELKDIKVNKIL